MFSEIFRKIGITCKFSEINPFQSKANDWFLCDGNFGVKRVKITDRK